MKRLCRAALFTLLASVEAFGQTGWVEIAYPTQDNLRLTNPVVVSAWAIPHSVTLTNRVGTSNVVGVQEFLTDIRNDASTNETAVNTLSWYCEVWSPTGTWSFVDTRTVTNHFAPTNLVLQSRDVWAWDAYWAMRERYLAQVPPATDNFPVAGGGWPSVPTPRFYRSNREALIFTKEWIVASLGYSYSSPAYHYWVDMAAADVAGTFNSVMVTNDAFPRLTLSNVLVRSDAPTNWPYFTPSRDLACASGLYPSLMTNTFVMMEDADLDDFWEDVFGHRYIDSCGGEHVFYGHTNMEIITVVCTNAYVEAGHTMSDYGWCVVRAAFTCMVATASGDPFTKDWTLIVTNDRPMDMSTSAVTKLYRDCGIAPSTVVTRTGSGYAAGGYDAPWVQPSDANWVDQTNRPSMNDFPGTAQNILMVNACPYDWVSTGVGDYFMRARNKGEFYFDQSTIPCCPFYDTESVDAWEYTEAGYQYSFRKPLEPTPFTALTTGLVAYWSATVTNLRPVIDVYWISDGQWELTGWTQTFADIDYQTSGSYSNFRVVSMSYGSNALAALSDLTGKTNPVRRTSILPTLYTNETYAPSSMIWAVNYNYTSLWPAALDIRTTWPAIITTTIVHSASYTNVYTGLTTVHCYDLGGLDVPYFRTEGAYNEVKAAMYPNHAWVTYPRRSVFLWNTTNGFRYR